MAKRIIAEFPPKRESDRSEVEIKELTERQMEILQLVAKGLTYKDVGNRLFLTERTIKYHMGEILTRLRLKGRRAAMEYARRRGIK